MKSLEEVAIEGGIKNNAVIFDGPTARNVMFYVMARKIVEENGQPIALTDDDLEMIARSLIEETGQSTMYSTPIKIGKNTIVYSAQRELTAEDREAQMADLRGTPREVYLVLPTEFNRKKHNSRVQRFPAMELTGRVPEAFVNWMGIYGYTRAKAVETYNHLIGTQFPVPEGRRKRGIGKKVRIAAAALGLIGLAAAGIHRVNQITNSPRYQAAIEEAAEIPGTNVYNARHGK